MSDSEGQVTATEYEPDDGLRELLDEVLQEATVSYDDEQDLAAARNDTSPSEAEIRRIVRDEYENIEEMD